MTLGLSGLDVRDEELQRRSPVPMWVFRCVSKSGWFLRWSVPTYQLDIQQEKHTSRDLVVDTYEVQHASTRHLQ